MHINIAGKLIYKIIAIFDIVLRIVKRMLSEKRELDADKPRLNP